MTALPRRLQITKNGIGDRSPKMRSVIALVHVVTSDQRSLLSMSFVLSESLAGRWVGSSEQKQ